MATTMKIKLIHRSSPSGETDIRVTRHAVPVTFASIASKAASVYNLDASSILLKYCDNDGDLISLVDDADVAEAFFDDSSSVNTRVNRVHVLECRSTPSIDVCHRGAERDRKSPGARNNGYNGQRVHCLRDGPFQTWCKWGLGPWPRGSLRMPGRHICNVMREGRQGIDSNCFLKNDPNSDHVDSVEFPETKICGRSSPRGERGAGLHKVVKPLLTQLRDSLASIDVASDVTINVSILAPVSGSDSAPPMKVSEFDVAVSEEILRRYKKRACEANRLHGWRQRQSNHSRQRNNVTTDYKADDSRISDSTDDVSAGDKAKSSETGDNITCDDGQAAKIQERLRRRLLRKASKKHKQLQCDNSVTDAPGMAVDERGAVSDGVDETEYVHVEDSISNDVHTNVTPTAVATGASLDEKPDDTAATIKHAGDDTVNKHNNDASISEDGMSISAKLELLREMGFTFDEAYGRRFIHAMDGRIDLVVAALVKNKLV